MRLRTCNSCVVSWHRPAEPAFAAPCIFELCVVGTYTSVPTFMPVLACMHVLFSLALSCLMRFLSQATQVTVGCVARHMVCLAFEAVEPRRDWPFEKFVMPLIQPLE